jgi:hypothetical protein
MNSLLTQNLNAIRQEELRAERRYDALLKEARCSQTSTQPSKHVLVTFLKRTMLLR